jgi:arginase
VFIIKDIDIIGMGIKYGCFVNGADMAYDSLKEILNQTFDNKTMCKVDNNLDKVIEYEDNSKIRYITPVMQLSKRLYNKVLESHINNNLPIIIGGDHSTAIGSISADLDYYKGDVSVIWIDAHTDIHSDTTTPSGNIHGMPLSILIGRCNDKFNIGKYRLNPKNIYYIGLRNYEIEEITYVKDNEITHYMDYETNEDIVNEIISKINTRYVHISFDFDSLNDEEFHAVNVSVNGNYQSKGGLSLVMVQTVLKKLLTSLNVCTIDTVEYNSLLDKNNECLNKAKMVFETINNSVKK